jgi:hypothetical protein
MKLFKHAHVRRDKDPQGGFHAYIRQQKVAHFPTWEKSAEWLKRVRTMRECDFREKNNTCT